MFTGNVLLCGQEALRSNLAVDRTTKPPQNELVNAIPDLLHLGPVQLALGAYIGLEFNDNINVSEADPVSDLVTRLGVNVDFKWPVGERSELRFGAGLGYLHYLKTSSANGLEVAPNSALSWDITFPDGSVTLYDQFSYDRRVVTESALSDAISFPRIDNTVGARVNWLPGREVFQVGYGHDDFLTTSSTYDYLNRSSEYLFGRAGWRLAENTQFGVEASSSFTSYQLSLQRNNDSVSVGPYVDWQITQAIHSSIRGGPTFYRFEPTPSEPTSSELSTYYFGADVRHQLTDFFSHALSVSHNIRQGVSQGSDYIEETSLSYSLSWALTQHLTAQAQITYLQGIQPERKSVRVLVPVQGGYVLQDGVLNLTERYDRYGIGPNVGWRIANKLTATLSYTRWERTSNLPGQGYVQNSIGLQLDYSF
jgi:hypothetical protein